MLKKFFLFFLGLPFYLIGFLTGCSLVLPPMLYAAPIPALKIRGKILDADTQTELSNIRVNLLKDSTVLESLTFQDENFYFTEYTAEAGNYCIIAEDTDGTNNGFYSSLTNRFDIQDFPFETNLTLKMKKQ